MKKQWFYKIISRFYIADIYTALFLNKAYCAIVAYHRISPLWKDCLFPDIVVDPLKFESQIKYLRENYEIIPLSHLESFFQEKQSKKAKAAVITFDDGYGDNYTYALPILQKYRVPATIFISTAFIETKRAFWWDILEFILRKTNLTRLSFEYNNNKYIFNTDTRNKPKVFQQIANLLKYADELTRENLLSLVSDLLQVKVSGLYPSILSWKQIEDMRHYNICFGSHAHNHQRLVNLDEKKLTEELSLSKELLENRLGQKVEDFAYPYGEKCDIEDKTKNMLSLSGYKRGLTMIQGHVLRDDDAFILRRIAISGNDTIDSFKLKLKGMLPLRRK